MATVYVGPEWDPPMWAGDKGPDRAVLAADSGADAVVGATGKGGAAVIGRVPDAAALAIELVRRGVHTMVYDVNTINPGEWESLERAATRAGVRLRCGSHIARFVPVMAGVRAYAGGHVSITATLIVGPGNGSGGPNGQAVCALAADVAMVTFGEAPQAVFASAPEHPHSYGEGEDDEDDGNQVFASAPEGHKRGVVNHTAVMMRFSKGRAAFLSVDAWDFEGDVAFYTPPDAARVGIVVSGHGGLLRRANLPEGSINASRIAAPSSFLLGMRISGSEGEDENEDGDLTPYLPTMMAELETGAAPAWPPPEWTRAEGAMPNIPPWFHVPGASPMWPAGTILKAGQPAQASLPPPSSLAHVMEAILVSINTGAPVYLDQR